MKNWIASVIAWFRGLFQGFRKHDVLSVKTLEEVDKDTLKPALLYIEARGGKDRWLHMRCPCGCRDVISLNLMTSTRPFWSLTRHADGTLSVMPSVDKTSGCRSHFFIRRSRIDWAGQHSTR